MIKKLIEEKTQESFERETKLLGVKDAIYF